MTKVLYGFRVSSESSEATPLPSLRGLVAYGLAQKRCVCASS